MAQGAAISDTVVVHGQQGAVGEDGSNYQGLERGVVHDGEGGTPGKGVLSEEKQGSTGASEGWCLPAHSRRGTGRMGEGEEALDWVSMGAHMHLNNMGFKE